MARANVYFSHWAVPHGIKGISKKILQDSAPLDISSRRKGHLFGHSIEINLNVRIYRSHLLFDQFKGSPRRESLPDCAVLFLQEMREQPMCSAGTFKPLLKLLGNDR